MKKVLLIGVVSAIALSACASPPKVDYSKVDAECGRMCQKDEGDCLARFAEFPTLLYTHCKPEAAACAKACPPPGTITVKSTSNSTGPSSEKPSIAERFKLLEELHKNGVITDKEYNDKRQEILKGL